MRVTFRTKNRHFVETFIPRILKTYVEEMYYPRKAERLNELLKANGINQSVKDVIIYIIDNLKLVKVFRGYRLEVDKNKVLSPSTINLDTLAKLIESGTLQVKGYTLLSDAFLYVEQSMKLLTRIYIINYEGVDK